MDATLVRLADSTTRAALFDAAALQQLVEAAYDTASMPVQGPYTPVFDDFRLGLAIPSLGAIDGNWGHLGTPDKVEATFRVSGLGPDSLVRVDALWRGQIVAQTVTSTDRITKMSITWPSPGRIDAEIGAALGALPADRTVLEQQRRTRLLAHVRAGLNQPAELTDAAFDAWLARTGATSVGDLIERFPGTLESGTAQIQFAAPQANPPSARGLPFTGALLVRESTFSVAQLLMDSKTVAEHLSSSGLERSADPTLRVRVPIVVVWVLPLAVFDDADWPGGAAGMPADQLRAARRVAAGQWLSREGIGLVATG